MNKKKSSKVEGKVKEIKKAGPHTTRRVGDLEVSYWGTPDRAVGSQA